MDVEIILLAVPLLKKFSSGFTKVYLIPLNVVFKGVQKRDVGDRAEHSTGGSHPSLPVVESTLQLLEQAGGGATLHHPALW